MLSMVLPLPQEEIRVTSPIPRALTCSLQSIRLTEAISSSWWATNFNSTRFHHHVKAFLQLIAAEATGSGCVEPYGVGESVVPYPRPRATHAGLAFFCVWSCKLFSVLLELPPSAGPSVVARLDQSLPGIWIYFTSPITATTSLWLLSALAASPVSQMFFHSCLCKLYSFSPSGLEVRWL